jgi:hypothetical protein
MDLMRSYIFVTFFILVFVVLNHKIKQIFIKETPEEARNMLSFFAHVQEIVDLQRANSAPFLIKKIHFCPNHQN